MGSNKISLSIFDVSGFIHAGSTAPSFSKLAVEGYPVGGIRYLLGYLTKELKRNSDIVCCFDSKITERKETNHGYKAGRPVKHSIYSQMDFIYKMLKQSGITCLKYNGQEADNLIYNVVEANKKDYTHIYIYSTDYDILHNVDVNVEFIGATSMVNDINYKTFSDGIYPGVTIPWNSISAYKVFCGDKSDNIKPFTCDDGTSGKECFEGFIDIMTSMFQNKLQTDRTEYVELRDRRVFDLFLKIARDEFTDTDIERLTKRANLIYPSKNELTDYTICSNYYSIDYSKYADLLNLVGDRTSLKRFTGSGSTRPLKPHELSMVREYAEELTNGSFAVDKSLAFSQPVDNAQSLMIKGF